MNPSHIERYELREVIGVGGMGSVYRAFDPRTKQEVAIKVPNLRVNDAGDVEQRARQELEVLLSLRNHPGIVTVYDFTSEPFGIVMELLDGRSLRDIIHKAPNGIPVEDALNYTEDILTAVAYAHHLGVLHRDLKPSNIIVTTLGSQKILKVMDFGLAALFDGGGPRFTQTGLVMGTPAYMAPEQCLSKDMDPRTDVYPIGLVLYELLTGVMPFERGSEFEMMRSQVETDVPAPSRRKVTVPFCVDALVERATQKEPSHRFATCEEFVEAIAEARRLIAIDASVPPTDHNVDTPFGSSDSQEAPAATSDAPTRVKTVSAAPPAADGPVTTAAKVWSKTIAPVERGWLTLRKSSVGVALSDRWSQLADTPAGTATGRAWRQAANSPPGVFVTQHRLSIVVGIAIFASVLTLISKPSETPTPHAVTSEIALGTPCGPCELDQWVEGEDGPVCNGETACPELPFTHSLLACDALTPCVDGQHCLSGYCVDARDQTTALAGPHFTPGTSWLVSEWPALIPLPRNATLDSSKGNGRLYDAPDVFSGRRGSRVYDGATVHVLETMCGGDGGRWARVRILSNPNDPDSNDLVGEEGWLRRQVLAPHGNGCCAGRDFDCGWRDASEGEFFQEATVPELPLAVSDDTMAVRTAPIYNHDIDNRVDRLRRRAQVTVSREICTPSGYRWVYVTAGSPGNPIQGWSLRMSLSGDGPRCCPRPRARRSQIVYPEVCPVMKLSVVLAVLLTPSLASATWPATSIRLVAHEDVVASVTGPDGTFTLGTEHRIVAWAANGQPLAWTELEGATALALSPEGLEAFTDTERITLAPDSLAPIATTAIDGHCMTPAGVWTWNSADAATVRLVHPDGVVEIAAEIASEADVSCGADDGRPRIAWLDDHARLIAASGDALVTYAQPWPWASEPRVASLSGRDGWRAWSEGTQVFIPAEGGETVPLQTETPTPVGESPAALSPALTPRFLDWHPAGLTVGDLHGWRHVSTSSPPQVTRFSNVGWRLIGAANGLIAVCEDGQAPHLHAIDAATGATIWSHAISDACSEVHTFAANGNLTATVGGRAISLRDDAFWLDAPEGTRNLTPSRGLRQQRWAVVHGYSAGCAGTETSLVSLRGEESTRWDALCGAFDAIPVVDHDGRWTAIALLDTEQERARVYEAAHTDTPALIPIGANTPAWIVDTGTGYEVDTTETVHRSDGFVFTQQGRVLSVMSPIRGLNVIDLGERIILEGPGAVWAEQPGTGGAIWLDPEGVPQWLTPSSLGRTWDMRLMTLLRDP